jgi:hypothetical protein
MKCILRYLLYCPVQKTKGHHGQNNLRCSLSICCKTSCHLKMCRNSPKKTTSYSLHRVTYDFLKICLVCICFVASSTKREKVHKALPCFTTVVYSAQLKRNANRPITQRTHCLHGRRRHALLFSSERTNAHIRPNIVYTKIAPLFQRDSVPSQPS